LRLEKNDFKKSIFFMVCVYILSVWLKVWCDFIMVKVYLVKTVVAVDIVSKMTKNDIYEIILCVKRK
jgi:hypothetical protein